MSAMSTPLVTAWRVTLTVQTALHIGDGTRLREGADFVLEGGTPPSRARRIDVDRALTLMTDPEIAQARDGMIARALGEARRAQATLAVLDLHRMGHDGRPGEVLALIRDADERPYIPGSSLKGAIRTALLRCMASTGNTAALAEVATRYNGASHLEEGAFRAGVFPDREASGANRDLLRVVRVSDLYAPPRRPPTVAFVETQVRRVDRSGEPVLSVWVEAVLRGAGFVGTIALDTRLLREWPANRAVKELFHRLPEVLREDGRATLRAMAEWAGENGPFARWAALAAQSQNWLFPLGWGTGWLAHTIGPLLPSDQRRALANRLNLGRGRAPQNVPFPRSYKVARVPINDRVHDVPVPVGLVSLQFTPLPGGDTGRAP
jgi:CRISPR-associated protein Csm5